MPMSLSVSPSLYQTGRKQDIFLSGSMYCVLSPPFFGSVRLEKVHSRSSQQLSSDSKQAGLALAPSAAISVWQMSKTIAPKLISRSCICWREDLLQKVGIDPFTPFLPPQPPPPFGYLCACFSTLFETKKGRNFFWVGCPSANIVEGWENQPAASISSLPFVCVWGGEGYFHPRFGL